MTGRRLPAKPEDELNDVREHHIDQQKKHSSNSGHHKDSDGGGPGFATCSPGNTRDFLADLPYKLCWRCFCHGCLVPIQVTFNASNTALLQTQNEHTARFKIPTIWRPVCFSSDVCRYRRACLAKSMAIGNRFIATLPAILIIADHVLTKCRSTANAGTNPVICFADRPASLPLPLCPTSAAPRSAPAESSDPRQGQSQRFRKKRCRSSVLHRTGRLPPRYSGRQHALRR